MLEKKTYAILKSTGEQIDRLFNFRKNNVSTKGKVKMNKFKFFMAMLLASAATLAFYGCSDNQADTGAKKADEKTTEVKVQEDAAAKKAKEEAEKKAQAEAAAKKAKEEAEKKAQAEAAAKQMAIYDQAEEAFNSFIANVRNNRIRMGGAIRNRVLNYNNEMMGMITESYVIFRGNSNGEKLSFHIVKTNGVWKCADIERDWNVVQDFVK